MTAIKEQAVELLNGLTEADAFFIVRIMQNLGEKEQRATASEGIRLLNSIVGIVPSDIMLEDAKSEYLGKKHEAAH